MAKTMTLGSEPESVDLIVNGMLVAESINGYTIEEDVPAGAIFTDTLYYNRAASNNGTSDSLVTTGDKYKWNTTTTNLETIDTIVYNTYTSLEDALNALVVADNFSAVNHRNFTVTISGSTNSYYKIEASKYNIDWVCGIVVTPTYTGEIYQFSKKITSPYTLTKRKLQGALQSYYHTFTNRTTAISASSWTQISTDTLTIAANTLESGCYLFSYTAQIRGNGSGNVLTRLLCNNSEIGGDTRSRSTAPTTTNFYSSLNCSFTYQIDSSSALTIAPQSFSSVSVVPSACYLSITRVSDGYTQI